MIEAKHIQGYIEHIDSLSEGDFQEHIQTLWDNNGLLLEYCELILEEETEDYDYLLDFYVSACVFIMQEEGLLEKISDNDLLETKEEDFWELEGQVAEGEKPLSSISKENNMIEAFTQMLTSDEDLEEKERAIVFPVILFILYLSK